MSDNRKTPNQTKATQPKRGQVPDPLKKGMSADGGHLLRGAGMFASAQQSGSGLGESSMSRNWDAGGEPSQDDRGTISTGPDTAPHERQRQHQVQQEQQGKQQQQNVGSAPSDQQDEPDPNRGHEQPPLHETTPPDVLARDPDVTKR